MQIIKRILTVLPFFFLGGVAYADPHLSGALIQSINTDLSHYSGGEQLRLIVTISNLTGKPFTGTITGTVTGRGVQVGEPVSVSVSDLAIGTTKKTELRFPSTDTNWQGYFVDLTATDQNGHQLDQEAGAFDISSDWQTYPRQCWIVGTYTQWGKFVPYMFNTPQEDVKGLNAYKCNNLQFYNMIYRWHQPWVEGKSWVNGDGETINVNLIKEHIEAAKSFHMGTLMYMPMYSANYRIVPNFTQDGSGAQLSWGMFTSACGSKCTMDDLFKFVVNKKDKPYISYMNPNNPAWQRYWGQQTELMRQHLGFDGMFVDTYGTIDRPLWDWSGNRVIMDKAYSSFLKEVQKYMNGPIVVNPASTYNEQDLVQSGHEAYHFTERWNNTSDISTFGDFLTRARQIWGWADRKPNNIGLDWDMGLNIDRQGSQDCNTESCTFNTPGVLYQEAAILATGAHHAWIVDGQQQAGNGARFIGNIDYPIGTMPTPKPDMVQREYDYQNFGVAYEKLLRLNIHASTVSAPSILSGAAGSTTAAVGKVWLFQNHRSGFDILHVLNYQQMSAASFQDVDDDAANAAAPIRTGPLQLKMYVTTGGSVGNLYTASPDINHGAPITLPYAKGQDSSGSYITFTLPSLKFWDMVWLENDVANSDYKTP
ncbi:dextranase [Saccharibacter sp. 17.LH.SD]|uniref:glycoside hydrolase family 66 protein n=1 Tax=Saccharibacter sp. 17.LH.SD TaxID=2689393 RepID=UPI001370E2BB|nr:glycoside hydrolase family 66 protein [Saccharibacter sp. 17.LH.SD]MXV43583.1 dextranase [Saccharibacter sp. 17.LH.SD]